MLYSRSSYLSLPSKPGVYQFLDERNDILYVGKAKNLKDRVSSYFVSNTNLGAKTKVLVSQIKKIKIIIVESELESLLLEAFYIKKYIPRYNIRLTDNKSYPLIKITMKDTYPAIVMARKIDNPNAVYFGPYPSSSSVKLVLKTIRRVFPFISALNHPKRLCLYHHLSLCPCLPASDSPENRKKYRQDLRQIVRILEGESQKILKEMMKERDKVSKAEKFEEAGLLQKRIIALSYITQPFHTPFEYDVNPNLRTDLRQKELNQLRETLLPFIPHLPPIHKIECYDISNFQGKQQVASMVVSVDGEKESSLYRKFKIKREETPNDFASMKEVLSRRLKHNEWSLPELLIVDGGKGQVSSAKAVFEEMGIGIPLIGLAKREETIVVPILPEQIPTNLSELKVIKDTEKLHFIEISLPKDSPALHLIVRIRDEAHRFAITYHRKLRSKNVTK